MFVLMFIQVYYLFILFLQVIMSPKIFGRHIVFAFGVCLSVRLLSVRIKLVRPSQVKLLVGFQLNFTGVISTIPSCAHHLHKMAARAKNRKILSALHKSNYLHFTGMFRFAAQNGHQS
jgi:hypothetical protein